MLAYLACVAITLDSVSSQQHPMYSLYLVPTCIHLVPVLCTGTRSSLTLFSWILEIFPLLSIYLLWSCTIFPRLLLKSPGWHWFPVVATTLANISWMQRFSCFPLKYTIISPASLFLQICTSFPSLSLSVFRPCQYFEAELSLLCVFSAFVQEGSFLIGADCYLIHKKKEAEEPKKYQHWFLYTLLVHIQLPGL